MRAIRQAGFPDYSGCFIPGKIEGFGGRRGVRTPDPRIANAVLSQLS